MPIQPGVWGIDLGQCALKAIRLQEIDGEITATAFDYVEHPKILSQPDADPDQLTREALDKFLSRNTLRGDIVSISVPGQSGLARFVKLPPVEEKKIADIVKFEAKQQIPFNLDEVVWDYQKLGSGDVTDGFAMNIEIGLFAMKRDMINRYMQHFKDVGVEIHHVQMAPLALCNFVSYDLLGKGARGKDEEEADEKPGCVVALDIGADSSNLIITDAERVIWQRPIPLGGNHFTRALTKELKLTFAKAEHLKRNAMKSPDLKKILTALKPVLNDFVGEVQRSLGYFTNTHRDAQIEYMVGLGNAFRLPGLQRYLGEKLSLEVRKLGKMERLGGDSVLSQPTFSENILTFGVAYGLALQGMKQARLLTNLLPNEIRVERLVRAKKPWAVAAAALLLIGTTALAFKATRETHAYTAKEVGTALVGAKASIDAINDAEKKYKDAVKDATDEEDAVRSIVAGQPEFKNWLEMMSFVSNCLPQPDGTNLSATAKQKYWDTLSADPTHPPTTPMTGKDAFARWKERLQSGASGGSTVRDELGAGIDDLVQLNIQSLDARFTDDLTAFWKEARKSPPASADENVRPRDQAQKPPEGKGWIMEIQGYTFHHKGETFVRDTLMDNLAFNGIKDGGKAAAEANKDKGPVDRKIPSEGPVINRISHVLLFKAPQPKETSDTSSFEVLGRNYLTDLAKAVSAPVPITPAPGAQPLSAAAQAAAAAAAALPNARDTWKPLGFSAAAAAAKAPPVAPPSTTVPSSPHRRTEFVVLFIWKEPTPSAQGRKEEQGKGVNLTGNVEQVEVPDMPDMPPE